MGASRVRCHTCRVHAARPDPALPRLLYVEDEEEIAGIVTEVLSDAYAVDHAATGEQAVAMALSGAYDVMVVDRRLPGMSGDEVVRAIRTAHLSTPVLMLTALGAVQDRVEGLDLGADDYLVKPFDFAELLARLRALRRGTRAAPARRELGDWIYVPSARALFSDGGRRVALTDAENALVDLLSSSPDHVFSREAILARVFPEGEALSTVDTYVHYVRRKSSPEVIETVRGRGYRCGAAA